MTRLTDRFRVWESFVRSDVCQEFPTALLLQPPDVSICLFAAEAHEPHLIPESTTWLLVGRREEDLQR